MKNWFWLGVILLFYGTTAAQTTSDSIRTGSSVPRAALDTTNLSAGDSLRTAAGKEKKFMPVPKTATRLALIPGGGQIYNRDYWKLPLVYAGVGGGIYAFYLNTIKYKDYLNAYKSFYNLDPNSPNYGDLIDTVKINPDYKVPVRVRNLLNTKSEYLPASRDQAARGKNYWRRNRGFAIIVTGLFYSLSIIEANVAAHLKTFDLSDDLSMRIEPKLQQPAMKSATPGLRLVFNFK